MLNINIINDETGDEIIGNYDYYVSINDKLIKCGRLEDFNRLSGWQGLIAYLGEMVYKKEDE